MLRVGLQQDKLAPLTPVQLSVGEQRGGFRKALFRGLEGETSTLGAKRGLVRKGGTRDCIAGWIYRRLA